MFRANQLRVLRLTPLVLAGVTMCARPTVAQQWGDASAGGVRTQGVDPQSSAAGNYSSAIPNDMRFQGPTQPMPVSRPVNWPGTPVDAAAAPATPAGNPAATAPNSSAVRGGVRVWDPLPPQSTTNAPPSAGAAIPGTAPAVAASPPISAASAAAPGYPNTGYQPAAIPPQTNAAPAATVPQASAPPTYPQLASANLPNYPTTPFPATSATAENLQSAAAAAPASITPQGDPLAGSTNLQILPSPPKEYPDAQVAARIGGEVVLVGDLKGMAGDMLAQRKVQIPANQEAEFYEQADRQILKQVIETKLVFNDAIHTIPAAGLTTMETKVNEYFDKDQLPDMLKLYNVTTRQELDAKLREHGSSIDRARKQFFERIVAKEWLRQQVKQLDEEVPHAEVLGYYQQHLSDYEFPAKVRWEELMVRFDKYPSKEAAYAAMADLGNIAMRGAPFAEVAKARSQGSTAENGGAHDWTTKGSLVAKTLDDTLFRLPVGTYSQILETERGFHIIRVLERKDGGRTSFVDAQGDIKKKLKEEIVKKQINQYLDELRKKTPVTTMYDNLPGGFDSSGKTAASAN